MSKLYRYLVAGAITAVVLFLVWYFSNVVAYILVSAVLAIIGKPLTDLLSGLHVRRTRFPRSLAALCTLLAIWVVVVGVFWLFVPIVFQKIREFSSLDVPQIIQSFQEPLMSLESFIRRVFSISESEFSLVDAISEQIKPLLDIGVINNLALVDRYDGRRYGDRGFLHFVHYLFLLERKSPVYGYGRHHVPEKVRAQHHPGARLGDPSADPLFHRHRRRVVDHDADRFARLAHARFFGS